MNLNEKIYIAGHKGLVGSAIIRQLKSRGFTNLVVRSHNELDLINQYAVTQFFEHEKPAYVILAAAKVGGIKANNDYPADFIYNNIMIQTNVIHSAYKNNVKRLLFLGSTCIYPKLSKQPMREDSILSGLLEPTNEPYAIAKISGIKLCESYNRQYGTDFRSVMPTNLYGIHDNFHPEDSHVVPALISKFHSAKINNEPEVFIWGSGNVRREFLYVDDMADAAIFVLDMNQNLYNSNTKPMLSHINIGTGIDITIRELSKTIQKIVGFTGEIIFDSTKPEGTQKKLVDTTILSNMGWSFNMNLESGLKKTYDWFKISKEHKSEKTVEKNQ